MYESGCSFVRDGGNVSIDDKESESVGYVDWRYTVMSCAAFSPDLCLSLDLYRRTASLSGRYLVLLSCLPL